MSPNYYIGLLSGTSMDAIDAALVDFTTAQPELVATHNQPLPDNLHNDLLQLCKNQNLNLQQLGESDVAFAKVCAQAVKTLLKQSGIPANQIQAIGSHGQTIYHHPHGELPFTLQIGDPNTISELTGITTVADFRRRDVAKGGQGAPLTPIFHQAMFKERPCLVINIGGMANATVLTDETFTGFDTGPGNVLLDAWIQTQQQKPYDEDGTWAASGKVYEPLLQQLLSHEYFSKPLPKSCGREQFNLAWLQQQLSTFNNLPAEDVQATLLALTANSIYQACEQYLSVPTRLLLCGGGAYNTALVNQLGALFDPHLVETTADHGIAPEWVEAIAFAWFAKQTIEKQPLDFSAITGAHSAGIIGGIYRVILTA